MNRTIHGYTRTMQFDTNIFIVKRIKNIYIQCKA